MANSLPPGGRGQRGGRFAAAFLGTLESDVPLEDAEVKVCQEIFLERFEFEAGFAGHVADGRPVSGQTEGNLGSSTRIS
jgi:hypothetical protein